MSGTSRHAPAAFADSGGRGRAYLSARMPPRPALHRVATALLALLYFVAWGEPVTLHPCPTHDGVGATAGAHALALGPGPARGARGAHDHGTAATAHASAHADTHADAQAHRAPAEHGPPGGDDEHQCQCLGHGCCTAAVVVPAAQQVRWFVAVTRRADPPAADAPAAPRASARRLLPPATGPPALG